jgi:hypothetical protein
MGWVVGKWQSQVFLFEQKRVRHRPPQQDIAGRMTGIISQLEHLVVSAGDCVQAHESIVVYLLFNSL